MSEEKGLPYIVAHVAVSLDMKVTGFPIDLEQYYAHAFGIGADASITGSKTYLDGFRPYWREEVDNDFQAMENEELPFAVLVDSAGLTQGLLHLHRSSGYCRDIIVLHSKETPEEFLRYLDERNYPHHAFGKEKVDLQSGLIFLRQKYDINTLRVDSGGKLITLLLKLGLCDELSLMIHPCISGDGEILEEGDGKLLLTDEGHLMTGETVPLFCSGLQKGNLKLLECRILPNDILLMRYKII